MSANLLDTEAGGEQTQYEGAVTENVPSKKSGGQLGQPSSTEQPAGTAEAAAQRQARGEQTAENIRYGQTISEGGMGGMTKGMQGEGGEEGFGRVREGSGSGSGDGGAAGEREKAGYGGGRDMDRSVGA